LTENSDFFKFIDEEIKVNLTYIIASQLFYFINFFIFFLASFKKSLFKVA